MPHYVDALPQQDIPAPHLDLPDLIRLLPRRLPWDFNVWVTGRMARDGMSFDNLLFVAEMDHEPDSSQRGYFATFIRHTGITASLTHHWRNRSLEMIRLYNSGRLILDENLVYKEPPGPLHLNPLLTAEWLKTALPATVPTTKDVFLTGSIARYGYSRHDVDFLIPGSDKDEQLAVRKYFSDSLGVSVHCGGVVMPEREPVFLYRVYSGGSRCQL